MSHRCVSVWVCVCVCVRESVCVCVCVRYSVFTRRMCMCACVVFVCRECFDMGVLCSYVGSVSIWVFAFGELKFPHLVCGHVNVCGV